MPAQYVGKIVDDCVEKGVDSIIVISAGFKESGIDGAARERELLQKLKAHSIRMVGPNCLGLINTQANLNASFAAGMPAQGDVAFFTIRRALHVDIGLGNGRKHGVLEIYQYGETSRTSMRWI